MKTPLHEIVERAPDLVPITRARYVRDINQWIAYAGLDPINWTRIRAQDFYQSLLDRGLKVQSANRIMSSLRYASKWWAHREMRPELDFAVVRTAKEHVEKTRHALDERQAEALVLACKGDDPLAFRDLAFVVLELETGMRRMSMRSMLWEKMPLEPYPHAQVLMKDSGNVRRTVPISDTALRALNRWKAWCFTNGVKGGPVFRALERRMDRRGRITYKPSRTPLGLTAIQKMLSSRAESVDLHVYPHMFRHTFVTWRTNMGLQPQEIAAVTGHSLPALGAMAGYIDMFEVGARIRNTTPDWLRRLVEALE